MDDSPTHANETASDTREYIKALVLISVILGLVLLLVWIGIGGSCGCTTRPAG
jgi:flagellar biogenesis protein FliO